jgi:AcrR family transcriptional regulator
MGDKIHQPHLKTARDARAVRTREALRNALLRLLELKPLEQITIRDICEISGVGYTTFFRHHPTKESLLDDVAAEQIGRLVGLALPVKDVGSMNAASVALFTYVNEHRKLWLTLLTGGAEGAMRAELLKISRHIAATRAQPDSWPPTDIMTLLGVSSTIELLSWWLRLKKPLSIERVAELHEQFVLAPLLERRQPARARAARGKKSPQG